MTQMTNPESLLKRYKRKDGVSFLREPLNSWLPTYQAAVFWGRDRLDVGRDAKLAV